MAADTLTEAADTLVGHAIDKSAESAEADPAEASQLTSRQFYGKGVDDLGTEYEDYFKGHPGRKAEADEAQWIEGIKSGYMGTGSHENDYRGRPAYEK